MKLLHVLLPVMVLTGSAYPAQAQLFGRKVRLDTMQVPQLIVVARSDTDPSKRIAAIEQLREQDAKGYPEIAANLVEVMRADPMYKIRLEAMKALVRIRPMTPLVAQALQQTATYDANRLVRLETKMQIMFNGYYVSSTTNEPYPPTAPTREPPLSGAVVVPAPSAYTPITMPAQPVYTPNPPASVGPPGLPRPLPTRPPSNPGYSTALPQRPAEVPSPAPNQPVPVQQPLPSIPPAPLPPLPASPSVPPTSAADEPAVVPITPPR